MESICEDCPVDISGTWTNASHSSISSVWIPSGGDGDGDRDGDGDENGNGDGDGHGDGAGDGAGDGDGDGDDYIPERMPRASLDYIVWLHLRIHCSAIVVL